MFLNIITPSNKPHNIPKIWNTINIPKDNWRWIVVFDGDELPPIDPLPNTEFYFHKNPDSISGNSQRNFGLDRVESGFILFLDDDTVLHPLLWENVKMVEDSIDFVSFDSSWNTMGEGELSCDNLIWNNLVIRTKGSDPKIDHIDTGNYIVNSRISQKFRWDLSSYNSDGKFCLECFNSSLNKIYIPKILSFFNLLDNRRNYVIPFNRGWVSPSGIKIETEDSYYDYLPRLEHIYQGQEFGEPWFRNEKLYTSIVQKYPSGSKFVEVGCWKGKSSAYMAVEIANSGKEIEFFCVDTWEGSKEHVFSENKTQKIWDIFSQNMSPLSKYYKPIIGRSTDVSQKFENESLDFIYIDASHEYHDVKDDINHWLPKLKRGGIIAGDDYGNPDFPGVHKAVFEILDGYEVENGTWIWTRIK
jgi:SAM-dependent methyltransferase